jgi:F420-non-reducing hydrogenase iron-sulfur subunit
MAKIFEPIIVAFCCRWCTYAGADGAGTARMQYPPNVHIIRVNCSGMVHPNLITGTLLNGADGVLLCGCHIGDCHYVEGNKRAMDRADVIRLFLDGMGIEKERFRLEWVSAAEGARFCKIAEETTEQIKALGPSPYRQMTQIA